MTLQRTGLGQKRHMMRCKKCKKIFQCNLFCIPQLRRKKYYLTADARIKQHICVCYICDTTLPEWKDRCDKGNSVNLDRLV